MWTNKEIKQNAKFHLRTSFGVAFLIAIIYVISYLFISSVVTGIMGINMLDMVGTIRSLNIYVDPSGQPYFMESDLIQLMELFRDILIASLWAGLIMRIIDLILFQPANFSIKNWYSRNREVKMNPPAELVFSHFTTNYFRLLKANFWKQIWLFIWNAGSLILGFAYFAYLLERGFIDFTSRGFTNSQLQELALVSGVIIVLNFVFVIIYVNRSIAYTMYEYIIADNPRISAREALKLSKKMMKGNKWHFIGFMFTFILWIMLGSVLAPVGLAIITPYIEQSLAELYGTLRSQAVARGDITMERLGFYKAGEEPYNQSYDPSEYYGGYNAYQPGPYGAYNQPGYDQWQGYNQGQYNQGQWNQGYDQNQGQWGQGYDQNQGQWGQQYTQNQGQWNQGYYDPNQSFNQNQGHWGQQYDQNRDQNLDQNRDQNRDHWTQDDSNDEPEQD